MGKTWANTEWICETACKYLPTHQREHSRTQCNLCYDRQIQLVYIASEWFRHRLFPIKGGKMNDDAFESDQNSIPFFRVLDVRYHIEMDKDTIIWILSVGNGFFSKKNAAEIHCKPQANVINNEELVISSLLIIMFCLFLSPLLFALILHASSVHIFRMPCLCCLLSWYRIDLHLFSLLLLHSFSLWSLAIHRKIDKNYSPRFYSLILFSHAIWSNVGQWQHQA